MLTSVFFTSFVFIIACTMQMSFAQSLIPETRKGCYSLPRLVCRLQGTKNNLRTSGTIMFFPSYWPNRPKGRRCIVRIRAQVSGLKPGDHGFHIHTYGDIRRTDGKLAGGHFANPKGDKLPHGSPDDPKRHWGDLGNLTAWSGGNAGYLRYDPIIKLNGIVGRAIIVHAKPDMGSMEQPSGNAGSRVAQGVIGYANPKGPML